MGNPTMPTHGSHHHKTEKSLTPRVSNTIFLVKPEPITSPLQSVLSPEYNVLPSEQLFSVFVQEQLNPSYKKI